MTGRAFVTGAAGFIGSHLCDRLLGDGWTVVGLDNFDPFYPRAVKDDNLTGARAHPGFELVEADLRDPGTWRSAVAGADVVIHLAARAGVRPSIEEPGIYTEVNVDGTVHLLEACRTAGIPRVVFGSSSSVYGDDTPPPFREDAVCDRPISPYAATKRAGELISAVYAHLHGFRIAALRFFTVYGPRQRPDLAIRRFTRLVMAGTPIPQYGDGSTERDYTYVDDIVDGVVSAVTWTGQAGAGFDVFNLGGSRTVRLDRLIALIGEAVGAEPTIERLPSVAGDVRATFADIGKSQRILGYSPKVPIEEGIPRFVDWYRDQHERRT